MYGIRGLPLDWFHNYFPNRKQYVAVGDVELGLQTITCEIPQGSTLGPLLFLICINDLIYQIVLTKNLKIFADDTNVFTSASTVCASNCEQF